MKKFVRRVAKLRKGHELFTRSLGLPPGWEGLGVPVGYEGRRAHPLGRG